MPALGRDDAAEFVADFYDLALGYASWRQIGTRLERLTGAQSSFLWRLDASGLAVAGAASAHLDEPGTVAAYVAHYSRLDPWSGACAAQPATRIRRGTEFVPLRARFRMEAGRT